MRPWKSFIARSWTGTSGLSTVGGVPDALAAQTVPTAVEAVTTAARERERIVRRTEDLHRS
jgi:hypothetical protein